MRSKTLGALVAIAFAVSGCGGGVGDDEITTAPSVASTDSTASTTVDAEATTSDSLAPETVWVRNLLYFDEIEGLHTPLLDVFAPAETGLWPIVVTFHPDSSRNDKSSTTSLASTIAEQGAVVINPTRGGRGLNGGRSADIFRTSVDQATCAVWFAIENAAEYGGDVSDIRLVGFSGGANMAAAVAMYPSDDDSLCSAGATDFTVSEVVAFEGDFTLSPEWDNVLRDEPTFYDEMTVWSYLDDYKGGPFHVLVDTKTTIAIISGVEEYLDLRHPDGPIRETWEALGVIDEDQATLIEVNIMLHDLLLATGYETTLTTIEAANHSISQTAEAAIIDLLFGDADN